MSDNVLFNSMDAARAIGAEHKGSPRDIYSVHTDSRCCRINSLFFALKGTKTDGALFIDSAVSCGAAAVVVGAHVKKQYSIPFLQVENVFAALHRLAAWYVQNHLQQIIRIGITGSNGKTTTKELAGAALNAVAPSYVSAGNLNSETGLPLSVLNTPADVTYAVYELAANHQGEIAALADILRPQFAVITNIGTAHIGNFGGRENIAKEKKAVCKYFSGTETLIIPEDDDFSHMLADDVNGTVCLFGTHAQHAAMHSSKGMVRVKTNNCTINLHLPGKHNGKNVLAVLALLHELGLSERQVVNALENIELPTGRSDLIHLEKMWVLNDSYNANPDSMRESMSTAAQLAKDFHVDTVIFVLGAMKELGVFSDKEHIETASLALSLKPNVLCFVGDEFQRVADVIQTRARQYIDSTVIFFVNIVQDVWEVVKQYMQCNALILLKGSRAAEIEKVLPFITQERTGGISA